MRVIFLIMITIAVLQATETEIVHSSATLYLEHKNFSNSVQKKDGVVAGVGADVHFKDSAYKVNYEYGKTATKQPPLEDDLRTQKLFARYGYTLNKTLAFNLNAIKILRDNIAITDGGVAYGAGLSFSPSKALSSNFTQFYTIYDDFDVAQSELKLVYKSKYREVGFKLSSITKYIAIFDKHANSFTQNAQSSYVTSGVKVHAHYSSWHAGLGAYFGKRAFAIMNEGFKIQHHAMEFDRTYALGIGKNIGSFVLRAQYIYQRAEELPALNSDVIIQNIRLITNYKF
jgi:hypothetical protein